jgi:PIN domain nuclease of toxin-antitoxin system
MKALIDTHVFLWWNTDDPQLSVPAREFMREGTNDLFVSAATAWEIAIKVGCGRLVLPLAPGQYVPERMTLHRMQSLPVLLAHALKVSDLPPIHQDPFDRLLVAQCQVEGLPLLTADRLIALYDVDVIW